MCVCLLADDIECQEQTFILKPSNCTNLPTEIMLIIAKLCCRKRCGIEIRLWVVGKSVHSLEFLKHKNQEASEVFGISLCQDISDVNVFLSESIQVGYGSSTCLSTQ